MTRQRHDRVKVYRSLRRRLGHIQTLAWEEVFLKGCKFVGAPGFFAPAQKKNTALRRQAIDDVQQMLTGLERAGAMTRSGAHAMTCLFAVACHDRAPFGDYQREAYERRLKRAFLIDRLRLLTRRLLRRSRK
jgi:hypothetical protein